MARNGKIARMPELIRRRLNLRLRDGEEAELLLAWLNGLPEAQEVLKHWFNGVAVSPQNLTEWRQGGYLEWMRVQEEVELARELQEEAVSLDKAGNREGMSDHFGLVDQVRRLRHRSPKSRSRSRHGCCSRRSPGDFIG